MKKFFNFTRVSFMFVKEEEVTVPQEGDDLKDLGTNMENVTSRVKGNANKHTHIFTPYIYRGNIENSIDSCLFSE